MKREGVNYFAVGGFVIAGLLALGVALLAVSGVGGPEDDYVVRYRNVSGVRIGTPVYYEGYRIGAVTAIDPEHEATGTRYRVTLSVQSGWPVPEDCIAAAVASGVLGDVTIAISEGKSQRKLEPGAEIAGREGGDVFAAFNELAAEVQSLTRQSVRPLVDQLAATLGEGGPIVTDLRTLLVKLNEGADGLKKAVGPDNQRELSAFLSNANKLSSELRDTRQRLDAMVAQTESLVSESRPDAREAVRELRVSAQAIAERIDSVMEQLDTTTRNMREFSREIRANPNRLLSGTPPEDEAKK